MHQNQRFRDNFINKMDLKESKANGMKIYAMNLVW